MAFCDTQYRPAEREGGNFPFRTTKYAKDFQYWPALLELAGLGQFDLDPQLDFGKDLVEAGVA